MRVERVHFYAEDRPAGRCVNDCDPVRYVYQLLLQRDWDGRYVG